MVWPSPPGADAFRQIEIGAAAEADDAEPVARLHRIALADIAQDAPGDQPGDLHHRQVAAIRQAERDGVAFIVLARLVEAGIHELAVAIGDARHRAIAGTRFTCTSIPRGRSPPASAALAQAELGRRHRRHDADDVPIRGGQHQPARGPAPSARVAEEIQAEQGEDQAQPEQPGTQQQPPRTATAPAMIERPTCRMRRGQHEPQTLSESHGRGLCCVHPRSASYGRGAG